jgi:thiamine biosynthesis lipoprotein
MMKKTVALLVVACILCVLLTGCAPKQAENEFFAMDTVMKLTAYGKNGQEAVEAAEDEIIRLDALLSISSETSEVAAVNADGGGTLSEETSALIRRAEGFYRETGGAFDITVYPLVDAWGFYTEMYKVPSPAELANCLERTGGDKLQLDGNVLSFLESGMAIDLGGIAKGYASDRVCAICKEYGVKSAIITLGGNVYAIGTRPDGTPWKVAIQDPTDPAAYAGVLELEDKAAVTSGAYERYFEEDGVRYHHIINPKTGYPAESGLASVTIVSADGTMADALSTALFVMGKDTALDYWRQHSSEFDAVLVTDTGAVTVTRGIADCFSTTDGSPFEVAE